MSPLPWVARSTLEAVEAERDRLLRRVDKLEADLARAVEPRIAPRPPSRREQQDADPALLEIRQMIGGFENAFVRDAQMLEVEQAHKNGHSYAEIRDAMSRQLEDEGGEEPGEAIGRYLETLEGG